MLGNFAILASALGTFIKTELDFTIIDLIFWRGVASGVVSLRSMRGRSGEDVGEMPERLFGPAFYFLIEESADEEQLVRKPHEFSRFRLLWWPQGRSCLHGIVLLIGMANNSLTK